MTVWLGYKSGMMQAIIIMWHALGDRSTDWQHGYDELWEVGIRHRNGLSKKNDICVSFKSFQNACVLKTFIAPLL
jgi:hypothetical protein